MMNRLILILTFSFFVYPTCELCSQTLAGGEIYYELLSPKKYKVTAHVYRMCSTAPLNYLFGNVYGDTVIRAMNFKRIAISKINDTCGNPCNKQNAVSNSGFEKHTFIDTVDFNIAPYNVFVSKNICIVNFGIRQVGRYNSATTHDYGYFYLDASTNVCLNNIIKNRSPQFSVEPKLYTGCNMPLWYSPGPLDSTDNDSFAFSLTDVQSNYKTNLAYKGSHYAQLPFTPFCLPPGVVNCKPLPNAKPPRGFYFEDKTCTIGFTPTDCDEKGTVKFKIDEYRFNKQTKKYEWLGYVTREMFLQILKMPDNNTAQIIGINQYATCLGNKLCLTKKTLDQLAPNQKIADTTILFWDYGIKGGAFRIIDSAAREKQGELCWQMVKASGRLERFFYTLGTYDKKCNVNLSTSTTLIKVRPLPKYSYTNVGSKCGQVKWTASVFDSLYPEYKGTCDTKIKSFISNKVLFSSNKLIDSVNLHLDEKIIIEHIFNANSGINCPVIVLDTITIVNSFALPNVNDNRDSIICYGKQGKFYFQRSKVSNLLKFEWYLNNALINQTDTIIIRKISGNSQVKLIAINTSGCSADRTLDYTIRMHNAIISPGQKYCYGDTARIKANLETLKAPVKITWVVNNKYQTSVDSILSIIIQKDLHIYVLLMDSINCIFDDSSINLLYPKLYFKLKGTDVCNDSIAAIRASGLIGTAPFNYHWKINSKDTANNDTILKLNPKENLKIQLSINDNNSCKYLDSSTVVLISTPQVFLTHSFQACYNNAVAIVPLIKNRPNQINYQWTYNKAIISLDSILTRAFTSSQLIKLKVSNQLNCSTEDTLNISVIPSPIFSIFHDSLYHPSNFIITATSGNFKSYLWFNGKTTTKDSFWAAELGPPGNYKIWCKVMGSNGCETTDTVKIATNRNLSISNSYVMPVKLYPNPVNNILYIDIIQHSEMEVCAVDGSLLAKVHLNQGKNEISFSAFAKGFYLIKLNVNGTPIIYKLLKD